MSDTRLQPPARVEIPQLGGKNIVTDQADLARKLYLETIEKSQSVTPPPADKGALKPPIPGGQSGSITAIVDSGAKKLEKLTDLLLDNFNALDTNGDKYLSESELTGASESKGWNESQQGFFRSAAKNVELLSNMVRERINPIGQTIEGPWISREDLWCAKAALGTAGRFDIYANRRDIAKIQGSIVGGLAGLGIGALAETRVEQILAKSGGKLRYPASILVGAATAGSLLGIAAGGPIYEYNVGTSDDYYSGRRNELNKFQWDDKR